MEFKSQIATTREQSEKLLALGLKPETADMFWCEDGLSVSDWSQINSFRCYPPEDNTDEFYPAWSLSRLFELLPTKANIGTRSGYGFELHPANDGKTCILSYYCILQVETESPFDSCIGVISWLIDNNQFNNEYLR